jgi:hypothetical protein
MEAFEKREDLLMKNPVLAAAVYIDPRMHHKNSPKALLGELEQTAEVRITFYHLTLTFIVIFFRLCC